MGTRLFENKIFADFPREHTNGVKLIILPSNRLAMEAKPNVHQEPLTHWRTLAAGPDHFLISSYKPGNWLSHPFLNFFI